MHYKKLEKHDILENGNERGVIYLIFVLKVIIQVFVIRFYIY